MYIKQPVNYCSVILQSFTIILFLFFPNSIYYSVLSVMIETMFIWKFTRYDNAGMMGKWHET